MIILVLQVLISDYYPKTTVDDIKKLNRNDNF